MNRISLKLLSVLAIILFIAVIPIAVLAVTNENVSIISTINDESKQEYIIYIKETLEQKFKFAFTTNENPGEMDLIYINSISDLVKNQVAFLDAETYEKISQENKPIFMWAKDENENLILKGIQIDLTKSITKENINDVETLTKRIEVEIADSEEVMRKKYEISEISIFRLLQPERKENVEPQPQRRRNRTYTKKNKEYWEKLGKDKKTE